MYMYKEKLDDEHKNKIRESLKRYYAEHGTRPAWNKGVPTSDKTKEKQKEAKHRHPTRYWLGKHRDKKTINAMQEGLKKWSEGQDFHGEHARNWIGGTSTYWRNEARKIMSEELGRELLSSEIVHHIDGNYENNNVNNLVITNRSSHMKIHLKEIIGGRK